MSHSTLSLQAGKYDLVHPKEKQDDRLKRDHIQTEQVKTPSQL